MQQRKNTRKYTKTPAGFTTFGRAQQKHGIERSLHHVQYVWRCVGTIHSGGSGSSDACSSNGSVRIVAAVFTVK
jgi:hypothetical protein